MSAVTPSNITWAARAKAIIGEEEYTEQEEELVFIPGDFRQRTENTYDKPLDILVKVLE